MSTFEPLHSLAVGPGQATRILSEMKQGTIEDMRAEVVTKGESRRKAIYGCTLVCDSIGFYIEGLESSLAMCIDRVGPARLS
jgi:hypothetical protein